MTPEADALERALATATAAALAAGRLLLEQWARPFSGRSSKSSATDEVSDADRASEALVVARIRADHPRDAIVSEEGGGSAGASGRRWLVDPLDGTINWLYRIPHWCVTIACADADGPLAGVVYDPPRDEIFYATRGGGAWVGAGESAPRRLAVTAVADLALSLLADGFSYDPEERREQGRRESLLLPHVRDVRRMGSAALDLAWCAAGRLDCYAEAGGHPWDWEAGRLLVVEAGGVVSEAPGVRVGLPTLIASGPGIHRALRELVLRSVEGSQ